MLGKTLLLFFRILEKSSTLESLIVSKDECIFHFQKISIYIKSQEDKKSYLSENGFSFGYLGREVAEKEKTFFKFFINLFKKTILSFDNLYTLLSASENKLEEAFKIKVFFYKDELILKNTFYEYKENNNKKFEELDEYVKLSHKWNGTPVKIDHYLEFYLYVGSRFIKNRSLKVLEIGAYFGLFVDCLYKQGLDIQGIERNTDVMKKVVSPQVIFEDFFTFNPSYKYDCIVAVNFFHEDIAKNTYENRRGINLDDVVPLIKKCLSVLVEGGELLFNYDDTKEGRVVLQIIKDMGYPLLKIRGGVLVLVKESKGGIKKS